MSEYRIRSTGEVKTQGQIRSMHPNVSLPKVWNANVNETLGIDPVLASPKPDPSGDYKVVVRNGVEQDANGNWVHAWTENDMFQEYTDDDNNVVTVQDQIDAKVAADNAALEATERATRDDLLKATDHYGLSDVTMSEAMTTYRQALRDVPQQEGFPQTITWPTKPE
jgi:hypothetical protein